MYHPILTEAWNGQKIGYSTETLISTMFKVWTTCKKKENRVEEVRAALEAKGLKFTGPDTYDGGAH